MKKNKFPGKLALSVISGLLLYLAWPPFNTYYLIFIAFVPLLWLEDQYDKQTGKKSPLGIALLIFLTFLVWNTLTTYWIVYATFAGAAMAILINSTLMSIPVLLYSRMKKLINPGFAPFFFIFLWISFEYLHLRWDLAWPWLNLGNVFCTSPKIIQWYEYTGALGGSFWILLVNVLIFKLIKSGKDFALNPATRSLTISIVIVLFLPIIFSFIVKIPSSSPSGKNVVVVQPSIDPYSEKFDYQTIYNQLNKLIRLSESKIDENTVLVVWPETAISYPVDENDLQNDDKIIRIKAFLKKHPGVSLISGMDSYRSFAEDEKPSPTARQMAGDNGWYDAYNSTILLRFDGTHQIYHKAKLVPGVEQMPYPKFFKFIEKFALKLGGTSGSLGRQKEASVFNINDSFSVAPIICYESVFGDYLGDFIMKGANFITISTNDGWWRNTAGYKQHCRYSVLRAIEQRKFIARSANTGISCFVNPKGEITEPLGWWQSSAIKMDINLNSKQTFYAQYGDLTGLFSVIVAMVFLFSGIVQKFFTGKKKL